MSYEGGGPAPYGGSASAPIGAPTPGPSDDWEAVVDADEDAEKHDPSEHGAHARNATDNPDLAENVKENRGADAEAGVDDDNDRPEQHRDYSRSSDEGENEAEQDADTAGRDD